MKKAMFFTVAGAILMANAAYGQKLVAQVPFGFTANKMDLAAGQYELNAGAPIPTGHVRLVVSARKSVFLQTINREYSNEAARPRLVFRCADGHCALAEVWTADSVGYRINTPKVRPGTNIKMATVYLTRATEGD